MARNGPLPSADTGPSPSARASVDPGKGDDLAGIQPAGWAPHAPVAASAFVILALLALAVTPVLMTWRLDALHADGDATTSRAHRLTDSLKTLFVAEIILLHEIPGGGARSADDYREVRASQDRIITDLRALAPRISTISTDRVDALARFWARWRTVPDALATGRLSGEQATREMSRILADHDSMFAAEQQLDADIERVGAGRRAQGDNVLKVQRWLSSALGLLAVIAAMVVAWFAQREQRLTRALGRTIATSEQRRMDLETITESKNRLMRGFSHDVKNPIGAADGYLQLLADGVLGPIVETQRTSIDRARRSLRAALHLIGDLLELAKVETGRIGIELEPTDVRVVAREAGDLYRAQAEAKGLVLHIETSVDVPTILSDPRRVRQVLGNLISNAVKYTATGEVVVRVGAEDDPESRGRLSISVADTGLGIAKDKQRLLFQEFVRLDPTGEPGVGIGLAMSARIAEAIGGALTMRSESGHGSVFVLWLARE